MFQVPLHPALVHIPLGLAFVMPLLAAGLVWAAISGRLPRRTLAAAAMLQLVLSVSAVGALQTGERDEERVEKTVGEPAIERHEAMAQAFTAAAWGTFALAVAAAFLRRDALARGAAVAMTGGTLVVAGLGAATGMRGGELVYVHGAARAHMAAQVPVGKGTPAELGGHGPTPDRGEDGDEDDDD